MTKDQAIFALNNLVGADQKLAHVEADKIILAFLEENGCSEVTAAYKDLENRTGFWYA